jgi:GDP-L-fucose synthase
MNKDVKKYTLQDTTQVVGSAIWRTLTAKGYTNLISFDGAILETSKRSGGFMAAEKPLHDAAAKWVEFRPTTIIRINPLWKICNQKITNRYRIATGVQKFIFWKFMHLSKTGSTTSKKEEYLTGTLGTD